MAEADEYFIEEPTIVMLLLLISELVAVLIFIVFAILAIVLFRREYPKHLRRLLDTFHLPGKKVAHTPGKASTSKPATPSAVPTPTLSAPQPGHMNKDVKQDLKVEISGMDSDDVKSNKELFDSQTEMTEQSTEISEIINMQTPIIKPQEQSKDPKATVDVKCNEFGVNKVKPTDKRVDTVPTPINPKQK
ncbi:hypothetical protein DdX_13036 [Ditylenchus destructor]|uniref:Uncharacterized protein n=1 Tax=Ditylenchus destructor TaxID=166010 RepID=A0AAD4R355_9BILA|nr:hypothetical protein DdX_13036 [Ditylenchus destructor]